MADTLTARSPLENDGHRYDRRRDLLLRSPNGLPMRACESIVCPAAINADGFVSAGASVATVLGRALDSRSDPYWEHGQLCCNERYPMFAAEFAQCESPIEVSLLCAIYDRFAWAVIQREVQVAAQAPLPGGYRADIWMRSAGREWDIEADGREFHSPERDSIRDAHLFAAGIPVLRFSGADIRQDRRGMVAVIASAVLPATTGVRC